MGHAGFMSIGGYASSACMPLFGSMLNPWLRFHAAILFVRLLCSAVFVPLFDGRGYWYSSIRLRGDYLAIIISGLCRDYPRCPGKH